MAEEQEKQEKEAGKHGVWGAGAWTPQRCAVWHALEGDRRREFEAWVEAEKAHGACYAAQLLPPWDQIAKK